MIFCINTITIICIYIAVSGNGCRTFTTIVCINTVGIAFYGIFGCNSYVFGWYIRIINPDSIGSAWFNNLVNDKCRWSCTIVVCVNAMCFTNNSSGSNK